MKILYSIIICSFNEGKHLRLTIQNILDTAGHDQCEIIVVNDESTDQSTTFLKNKDYKKIRLINIAHSGVAKARNVGARRSNGQVLIFIDAHTRFDPGWLKRIDRLFNNNKSIKILTGSTNNYRSVIKKTKKYFYLYTNIDLAMRGAFFLKIKIKKRLYKVPFANGGGLVVYREVFDKIGGFFEGLRLWGIEDRFFSLVAYYFGYDIYLDTDFNIYHNLGQSYKGAKRKSRHILYNSLVACYTLYSDEAFQDSVKYLELIYPKLKNQTDYQLFLKIIPSLNFVKKTINKKVARTYDDFIKQYYFFLPSLQINDYRKACALIKTAPQSAYKLLLRSRKLTHTNNLYKTARIIVDINQKIKEVKKMLSNKNPL